MLKPITVVPRAGLSALKRENLRESDARDAVVAAISDATSV
ncbi:hypothetical protein [Burkholderia multivorans]|nr:hypothetical protein [Burkholderia multivorans]